MDPEDACNAIEQLEGEVTTLQEEVVSLKGRVVDLEQRFVEMANKVTVWMSKENDCGGSDRSDR